MRGKTRSAATIAGLVLAASLLLALAGATWASPAEHGDPSQHFNWTTIGYKGKNALGGTLEAGQEPMSPPMILMFMNFGIVLIIIGWKVRPLVSKYVRGRHDEIQQALDEAAALRQQAQEKLDEYTERVGKVEAEMDKLVSDIRASAEAEKKRIIADAETQAAAMKRDAESRIAAEIGRARTELEREVIAAAVAAAETLLRRQTGAGDQTRLIESFIKDVKTADKSASTQERA